MPSSATDKEYTVEKVVDYRKNNKGIDEYRIKWKGYRKSTWEPASNLNPEALKDAKSLKKRREEAAAKRKAASKRSNNNNKKRGLSKEDKKATGKTT